MEPPPSLFPTTSTPTAPGMSFNNHALMEFDITEQLNAYNESLMMNSNSTPDLQPEDVQDLIHQQDDVVEDDDYQTAVLNSLYDEYDDDESEHDPTSSNHNYHRPLSAYNLFLRDHNNGPQQALVLQGRKPNTPLPPTLPEMMAQAWRGLSPAARAHYEGLATTERTEYLANVAAKKKKQQRQRQQQQRQMRQTVAAETKSSQNMLTAMTPAQLQQLEPRPLAQSQPLPTNGNNNGFLTNNNNNNMIMMPQGTPTTDLSFMTPSYRRAIAELASKLDDASIDFLIRAFK